MSLHIESNNFEEKSGVYFITDSNRSHVRIGESANFKARLVEHVCSRGKTNTILLYFLECSNHRQMEKATHNYFKKYRLTNETNSFYSSDIIPLIEDYVKNSGLKYNTRTGITDLWGNQTDIRENRPRCFFFPEQTAHIIGKSGTGETYRTYRYQGRKVYISSKFHNLEMNLKRQMEGKSNSSNLNEFIPEEENKLEQFYQ
jgi:hypothetical protein